MSDKMGEPDKAPMPDSLRRLAESAKGRNLKRGATAPLDIMVPADDGTGSCFRSPYAEEDWELWLHLLLDTFGTRQPRVVNAFMRQLTNMIPDIWDEEVSANKTDVEMLTLALSIICSLKPQNEAQAAIAVNCVALYFVQFKVTDRMGSQSWLDVASAAALAAVGKSYAAQMKALGEMQKPARAKRQIIKVQKHVTVNHYHDEKHVHLPGEGGRDSGNQSQASGRQRAHATPAGSVPERPALRGPDTGGEVVSFARVEREEALPDARLGRRS